MPISTTRVHHTTDHMTTVISENKATVLSPHSTFDSSMASSQPSQTDLDFIISSILPSQTQGSGSFSLLQGSDTSSLPSQVSLADSTSMHFVSSTHIPVSTPKESLSDTRETEMPDSSSDSSQLFDNTYTLSIYPEGPAPSQIAEISSPEPSVEKITYSALEEISSDSSAVDVTPMIIGSFPSEESTQTIIGSNSLFPMDSSYSIFSSPSDTENSAFTNKHSATFSAFQTFTNIIEPSSEEPKQSDNPLLYFSTPSSQFRTIDTISGTETEVPVHILTAFHPELYASISTSVGNVGEISTSFGDLDTVILSTRTEAESQQTYPESEIHPSSITHIPEVSIDPSVLHGTLLDHSSSHFSLDDLSTETPHVEMSPTVSFEEASTAPASDIHEQETSSVVVASKGKGLCHDNISLSFCH